MLSNISHKNDQAQHGVVPFFPKSLGFPFTPPSLPSTPIVNANVTTSPCDCTSPASTPFLNSTSPSTTTSNAHFLSYSSVTSPSHFHSQSNPHYHSPPFSSSPSPFPTYHETSNTFSPPTSFHPSTHPSPCFNSLSSPSSSLSWLSLLDTTSSSLVTKFLNDMDFNDPTVIHASQRLQQPNPAKHHIQIMKHRLYTQLGNASHQLQLTKRYNESEVHEMETAAKTMLLFLQPSSLHNG
ncbi:hypothetical protein HMI54_014805 [Coelomomyces lativittatus]|nr:hypothetical protein HMI55_000045 [Coelomomyces lativittatus]KAJ1513679.1 hypothetical protein HMI54_014805 [Coelomomyces lativittatus]KAJ1515458.1 hypothetical protein HMI56_004544 [Coelomomyces lativittatus]